MTEKIETPVNKSLTGESAEPSGAQLGSIAQEGEQTSIFGLNELAEELLKWVNILKKQGKIDFFNVNRDQRLIKIHVNRATIDIESRGLDWSYVTYKVRVYGQFGQWISEAIIESDRIEYENEEIKLEFIEKNVKEDWNICVDFQCAKAFILDLIQHAKDGDLDEFLRNFIDYHIDLT